MATFFLICFRVQTAITFIPALILTFLLYLAPKHIYARQTVPTVVSHYFKTKIVLISSVLGSIFFNLLQA